MVDYKLRQATDNDLQAIEVLLAASGLPTVQVAPYVKQFWVAEAGDKSLVGVLGLQTERKQALLRSFAVAAPQRKCGTGLALVQHVLGQLRQQAYTEVYLLTQTADRYFARLGFGVIDRTAMPQTLLVQSGLDQACPCSSVCMQHKL